MPNIPLQDLQDLRADVEAADAYAVEADSSDTLEAAKRKIAKIRAKLADAIVKIQIMEAAGLPQE